MTKQVSLTRFEKEHVLGHRLPNEAHVVDLGAGNLAVKLAIDGRFSRVPTMDIRRGRL